MYAKIRLKISQFKTWNGVQYALPLLLVLLQLYVVLPSAQLKWDLIDETASLEKARSTWANNDFQLAEPGRFRPVFWLMQWMIPYRFFKLDAVGFHLFQILKYVALGLFLYGIVKRITNSSLAGFCAGTLFAFVPSIFENWVRLGPQEPWVTFFQAGSIFFLLLGLDVGQGDNPQSRWRWAWFVLAALFAVANYFVKETAITFAGIALVITLFAWSRTNWRVLVAYLGVNVLTAALVFQPIMARLQGGDYAGQYSASLFSRLDAFWRQAQGYWHYLDQDFGWFLPLALVTCAGLLVYELVIRRRFSMPLRWMCIVGAWFAVSFAIQIPWRYVLGRYMLPVAAPASILIGIVFGCLVNLWRSADLKPRGGRLLIGGLIIIFAAGTLWSLRVLPALRHGVVDAIPVRQKYHAIARSLAKLIPRDGTYFWAAPNEASEWPKAMGLMIAFLYNRPGLPVESLKLTPDLKYKHGDVVFLCSLEGPNPVPFKIKQVVNFFDGNLRFLPDISTDLPGDEWLFYQVDWGPLAEQRLAAQNVLALSSANVEEKARAHRNIAKAYEANGQVPRAIREYRLAADGEVSGALESLERLCASEGGKYRGERGCPKPNASEVYDVKMLEDFEGRKEPAFFQWGPNNAKHAVLVHTLESDVVYRGKQAERLAVQYAGYEEGKTTEYWMLNVNVPLTNETHVSWVTRGTRGVGMVMVVQFPGEHSGVMWDSGSDLDRKYQLEEWQAGDLDWQVNVSEDVYAWAKKTAQANGWKTDGMRIVRVGLHAASLNQNNIVIDNVQVWHVR